MADVAQFPQMRFDLNTGQKVSGLLHVGLIAWVMLSDVFAAPDEPMLPEVTEVSIISAQEFAQIMQNDPAPPRPEVPQPEPVEAPEPVQPAQIETPEPAPIRPPAPVTPVAPPTPSEPEATSDAPQAAVIAETTAPRSSIIPRQRPAQRVAPEPVDAPEPEIAIAPRDQAAITPDAQAQIDAQEAQEATQREAAATEVVTENTDLSTTDPVLNTATAPEVSLRPRRRPTRPAQVADTPEPTDRSRAIESALAEALGGALDFSEDTIPTPATALSQADADILRLSIEACWNIGLLSTEALGVVLTIGFEMTEDARPIPGSIRQVAAQGGSAAAQATAFDAGRQAIIQCGAQGYGLPPELYDQWRLVEITFRLARMSF